MRKSSYTLLFLVLLMLALAFASVVSADPITVDVTEPFTPTASAPQRIFRSGTASSCVANPYPGPFSSGGFPYSVAGTFGPVLEDSCVTINWDPLACGTGVHPMVFAESFDPSWGAANATNYLGDSGSSAVGSFSFPVSAGQTFVLIIMSNSSSAPDCSYHYDFVYEPAGEAEGPGCQLPVPADSVVGDLPFETQVYYEPGNVSPGVFLNPGTYIVTGQDETESYYQIVLACQFVWVPKENMQPSYQMPQNGAPLPSRIVEFTPADTTTESSIPAHD